MHMRTWIAGLAVFALSASPISHDRALERRGVGARTSGPITLESGVVIEVSSNGKIHDARNRLLYAWPTEREDARVRDMTAKDLDGDGRRELILAFADAARSSGGIAILEFEDGALRERSAFTRRDYLPLRVEAGDADDDGETELAVLLYDRAKADPASFAMKFHLFDLRENRLAPRWFSEREVEDFRIVEWDGHGRLLALERTSDGHALKLFRWENFGFWLEKTLLVSERPVRLEGDARRVIVREPESRKFVVCENGRVMTNIEL
jgi:hypothetical protein